MLFDNDAWRSTDDSIEGGYQRTNQELARRFVTLLAAGEIDGSQVSESAMDSSDIRRTLSTGGVSTIAYSEAAVEQETRKSQGLLGRLSTNGHDEESENSDLPMKIHGLVRKAVQSRLTCPADVSSAERALIVISGPPREFSQKGIQRARQWLEQETQSVEVLAGDDPAGTPTTSRPACSSRTSPTSPRRPAPGASGRCPRLHRRPGGDPRGRNRRPDHRRPEPH